MLAQKKFKKKYRSLYRYHRAQLKKFYNLGKVSFYGSLDYFICYLRFMRDFYLLFSDEDKQAQLNAASLFKAVDEFEQYISCMNKYYVQNKEGKLEQIDKNISKEEVLHTFLTEQSNHLRLFWATVSVSMED